MPGDGGVIARFARTPLIATLLMMAMLGAGGWALSQLNTQFFPDFTLDVINVQVVWPGAGAEDVEEGVTVPLEQDLRSLDGLREMTSTSAQGASSISLEFEPGTDMTLALDQARDAVERQRNLPEEAERPVVRRVIPHEPIARVLVHGPEDRRELRSVARSLERDLLAEGISRIDVQGLPEEEMAIQVPAATVAELGFGLDELGERIAARSQDLPAGVVGRDEAGQQLRSLDQRRTELGFERLPVMLGDNGARLTLGDLARIERRPRADEPLLRHQGTAAISLNLERSRAEDSLAASQTLHDYLNRARDRLPEAVEVDVYDEFWSLIAERIGLLLKNGVGGLALVLMILFLFLSAPAAVRVALSIPVAFTAALAVLHLTGGSINMISLFAMIMTLGLIVDNAIVVAEHGFAMRQRGADAQAAAEEGARRMLGPVFAASLTTLAAFLPLAMISGVIGRMLFDIPLVLICVILATLVIAFLILPAQMVPALAVSSQDAGRLRRGWERRFEAFRQGRFRRWVSYAVDAPMSTLALALALLILAVGLLAGGRIDFSFFPDPDSTVLQADIGFVAGTPPDRVADYAHAVEEALYDAEDALGGDLIETAVVHLRQGASTGATEAQQGDQFAAMTVELTSPDRREVRNREFIAAWEERVAAAPGLDQFAVSERQAGPPGRDVSVRLTGAEPERLKEAANSLARTLDEFDGLYAIEDDLPYGREQLVYTLSSEGEAAGLSLETLGRQLRAAYEGHLAQIFQDGLEEVEVRVLLPDAERDHLASLERLPIALPGGETTLLGNVAELTTRPGFEILRRTDGQLAVEVSAEIDRSVANAGAIRESLAERALPELAERHGVRYAFAGRAEDQAETMGDMRQGLVLTLLLIILVLAAVFGSWGWPFIVLAIVPFGLVGALVGHWLLGMELTILSLFGLFGLTGIVVNNAIILVSFYDGLRGEGYGRRDAVVEAAVRRLRAVVLTSLTTIAGLTPLLFEGSVQAQFLIPMAVSIVFGLGFATLLVLFVIPALLDLHERARDRLAPATGRRRWSTPDGTA